MNYTNAYDLYKEKVLYITLKLNQLTVNTTYNEQLRFNLFRFIYTHMKQYIEDKMVNFVYRGDLKNIIETILNIVDNFNLLKTYNLWIRDYIKSIINDDIDNEILTVGKYVQIAELTILEM